MKVILLALPLLMFIKCQKVEIKSDAPECIKEKISSNDKNNYPCESGKSVYRYFFHDRYVYVFNPGDCGADMMSTVYDENCTSICGLGGIAGNQLCEDVNFSEVATDETLIWED
jgi:hypothetical protein